MMSITPPPRPQTAPPAPTAPTRNRIRVCVRVRPMNQKENASQSNIISLLPPNVIVYDPSDEAVGNKSRYGLSKRNREMRYAFDRVFGENTLQEEVYEGSAQPLVQSVLAGYNCSVFAYGATGAGKTHTMMGNDTSGRGIMYRILEDIFHAFDAAEERNYSMHLSYLEVYNEQIRDLLASGTGKGKNLDLRQHKNNIQVAGLSKHNPQTIDEVFALLSRGGQNRVAAETKANSVSSRSHAIVIVEIIGKDPTSLSGTELNSKLCLVDLAGSERASVTDNKGARMREGANINTSLLALGNCINALTSNASYIPYRQSKLTQLLKDSLGGTAQTVMIANISPASGNAEESHNTLKYAHRAKEIRVVVKKNEKVVQKHVSQYQSMIEQLKDENMKLKHQLQETRQNSGLGDHEGVFLAFKQFKDSISNYQRELLQATIEIGKQRALIEEAISCITERTAEEEAFRKRNPHAHLAEMPPRLQVVRTVVQAAIKQREQAHNRLLEAEKEKAKVADTGLSLRKQIHREINNTDLKSALIMMLDGAEFSAKAEEARQGQRFAVRRSDNAHTRVETLQSCVPDLSRMIEILWKVCHGEKLSEEYVEMEYNNTLDIIDKARFTFIQEEKEREEIQRELTTPSIAIPSPLPADPPVARFQTPPPQLDLSKQFPALLIPDMLKDDSPPHPHPHLNTIQLPVQQPPTISILQTASQPVKETKHVVFAPPSPVKSFSNDDDTSMDVVTQHGFDSPAVSKVAVTLHKQDDRPHTAPSSHPHNVQSNHTHNVQSNHTHKTKQKREYHPKHGEGDDMDIETKYDHPDLHSVKLPLPTGNAPILDEDAHTALHNQMKALSAMNEKSKHRHRKPRKSTNSMSSAGGDTEPDNDQETAQPSKPDIFTRLNATHTASSSMKTHQPIAQTTKPEKKKPRVQFNPVPIIHNQDSPKPARPPSISFVVHDQSSGNHSQKENIPRFMQSTVAWQQKGRGQEHSIDSDLFLSDQTTVVFMSLKSGTIPKKKQDPLQKVIPKNPRYQHVQSNLDTGATAKKQEQMRDELPTHSTVNELFKRIKPGTVVRYIFEEDDLNDPSLPPESFEGPVKTPPHQPGMDSPKTIREARERNLGGSNVSSLLASDESQPQPAPKPTQQQGGIYTPHFLLLDIRDEDFYKECHIKYAQHFPAALLSRASNYFTPEIISYQNKENKKIIVYCNDERESSRVATIMFQRGIDNIFIITGGLRKICNKYPEVLVGPKPPFPPDKELLRQRQHLSSTKSMVSVSNSSLVSSASTAKYLQGKLGPGAAGPVKTQSRPKASAGPTPSNPGAKAKPKGWK
ncbi:putative Chromosome-associated kinesin KIF4 [Blattamonas nauphoetae]|uniref:Chromosome-associated kinesin KIF4 n=1 Tax=Blattamonas nauphoetae TaxID=2049346 RepID=A0ABQ9XCI7_9EUKA|nr:putative Chromosome-associated kinesin KIF4 [Blattamonas nauphoetae]